MNDTPAIKPLRDLLISAPLAVSGFAGTGSAVLGFAGNRPCWGLLGAVIAGAGFIRSMAIRSPCVMFGPSRRGGIGIAGSTWRFMAAGSMSGAGGGP